jgi:hypothetical protein
LEETTRVDLDSGELIMAERRLPGGRSYFPIRVDIPSFSGGVGRSSPTKRIPSESENVDNFIVSLEHSAEKRRGVELLEQMDVDDLIGRLASVSEEHDDEDIAKKDLWYHWFLVSSTTKYLIIIDYKASAAGSQLLWVYKVNEDGKLSEELKEDVSAATRAYITWGSTATQGSNNAKSALRAVAVGSSLLILNTIVKAGYTSSEKDSTGEGYLRFMDGSVSGATDHQGKIVNYLTASTVDVSGSAEIWNKFSQYIAGDQVYSPEDSMSYDDSLIDYDAADPEDWQTSYDYLRNGLWEVTDEAADIVGPDGSGLSPRKPFAGIDKIHMNYGDLQGNMGTNYMYLGSFTGGTPTSKAVATAFLTYPEGGLIGKTMKGTDLLDKATLPDAHEDDYDWFSTEDSTDGTVGSLGYDNRFSLPYWAPNRRYADTNCADCAYSPSPSNSRSYEIIRFWFESGTGTAVDGWDRVGYKVSGGAIVPGAVVWDPDPLSNHPGHGDPLLADYAIYCRIYLGNCSTVQALVEHVTSAFNWYQTNGLISVTTTPNAGLNGWEWESTYFTQQWKRVEKDPLPPGFDADFLDENDAAYDTLGSGDENDGEGVGWAEYTDFLKVSDYYYPNPEHKYLGQAIAALSELKFPPDIADLTAFNGGTVVMDMIEDLYPDEAPTLGSGVGKLFYLSQNYSGLSEGYFRVKDVEEQPYLHKIRTPEAMSIIDKRRMPHHLVLDEEYYVDSNGDGELDELQPPTWRFKQIDWDPRDSGGVISNPGPSIFHDGEGKALQRAISAMSYYRGRLFLASEDILVSSRINDFDNFWINDPDNLGVADPLDLRVSSNAYTPITYLQPYRNFLFLATDGGIQYELLGSENQISPLTAEIAPTSFYNMTLDVNPVLLNNSLFFLDAKRLYIYFGEQTESAQNAIDISINAQGYLPENFEGITTSAATNSIFLIDEAVKNHVYCYTNRISGDQIAQNSFFRFIFPEEWTIKSIVGVEEYLYLVWEEEIPNSDLEPTSDTWTTINTGRIYLRNEDLNLPRMDSLMFRNSGHMLDGGEPELVGGGDTMFTIKSPTVSLDTIILWHNEEGFNIRGIDLPILSCYTAETSGYVRITVSNDQIVNLNAAGGFYLGKKFSANIELSPVFLRDENMDAQNGALNLRLGMFRFRNTGTFEVSVQRKTRDPVILPYVIDIVDDLSNLLDYKPYSDYGIFKIPILGFSHDVKINITSESVHPLTLSDVEFTGKFKYKLTALGSQ